MTRSPICCEPTPSIRTTRTISRPFWLDRISPPVSPTNTSSLSAPPSSLIPDIVQVNDVEEPVYSVSLKNLKSDGLFEDSALVSAATLSARYISDRFLPDKAIDLIDEACATIRTEIDSLPEEVDRISRRVTQLEIEEAALKKEKDEISKERILEIDKNLEILKKSM